MLFDLVTAKVKTSTLPFEQYVLFERREDRADIVLLSFNTFAPIDLEREIRGESDRIARIVQLSKDDSCIVFCGVETLIEGYKHLSVIVACKGKLYDLCSRTTNLGNDVYGETDKIKIYNTMMGKFAVLIDSDATLEYLWKKVAPDTDFAFCFVTDNRMTEDIRKLAGENQITTILLTTAGVQLIDI